jgi:hypothetical protein
VVRRAQRWDRDRLTLEIANRANVFRAEQLKAANVEACQEDHEITRVLADDARCRELAVDVDRARGQGDRRLFACSGSAADVLDIGKTFAAKKLFRHELGRDTDSGPVEQPDPSRFQRRLFAERIRSIEQPHRGS